MGFKEFLNENWQNEDDEYKNTSIDLKAGYNFNENNRLSVGHNIIKSKTNYDSILSDASWNTDPIASANSITVLHESASVSEDFIISAILQ